MRKWLSQLSIWFKKYGIVSRRPSTFSEERIWQFHKKFEYGVCYLVISWFIFFVLYPILPKAIVFSKYGISYSASAELLLLFMLLLAINSYFGLVKKLERKVAYTNLVEVQQLFIGNIISLFGAYLFLTLFNLWSYSWIFRIYILPFDRLVEFSAPVDVFQIAVTAMKLFYLIFVIIGLHMVSKYFHKQIIKFQHFVLIVLGAWLTIFIMGFSNLLIIFVLLDVLSFVIISLIALSSKHPEEGKEDDSLLYASHYYTYAVITSALGYIGLFLLYSCTNTFEVTAMLFINSVEETKFVFDNYAFIVAGYFLLTKLFFVLGAFPFQQYIMEACKVLNYGYLYFILVLFKFPAFVVFMVLMKVIWIKHAYFQYFIMLIGLLSVVYGALFILQSMIMKDFLGYSSINQVGVMITFISMHDMVSIYASVFTLLTYLVGNTAIFLLLSSSRVLGPLRPGEDGDMETWADLRRFVRDSHYMALAVRYDRGDKWSRADWHYFGVFTVGVAAVSVGGFPPLSGFFVKWAFVLMFVGKLHWIVTAAVVASALISTLSYLKIILIMTRERNWQDPDKYPVVRVSTIDGVDAFCFFICLIGMFLVTIFFVLPAAFWAFIWATSPFFFDNGAYAAAFAGAAKLINSGAGAAFMSVFNFGSLLPKFWGFIKKLSKVLYDTMHYLVRGVCSFFRGIGARLKKHWKTPIKSFFLSGSYARELAGILTFLAIDLIYWNTVVWPVSKSEWFMHWLSIVHIILFNFLACLIFAVILKKVAYYRAIFLWFWVGNVWFFENPSGPVGGVFDWLFYTYKYLAFAILDDSVNPFFGDERFTYAAAFCVDAWQELYLFMLAFFILAYMWCLYLAAEYYSDIYYFRPRGRKDEVPVMWIHTVSCFYRNMARYYCFVLLFFLFGPGSCGAEMFGLTPKVYLIIALSPYLLWAYDNRNKIREIINNIQSRSVAAYQARKDSWKKLNTECLFGSYFKEFTLTFTLIAFFSALAVIAVNSNEPMSASSYIIFWLHLAHTPAIHIAIFSSTVALAGGSVFLPRILFTGYLIFNVIAPDVVFWFWFYFYAFFYSLFYPYVFDMRTADFFQMHADLWKEVYLLGIGFFLWILILAFLTGAWNFHKDAVRIPTTPFGRYIWLWFYNKWLSKYGLFYYCAALLFFVFGPGDFGFVVTTHTPLLVFVALLKAFKLMTFSFVLLKLMFWFGWFFYFYTYLTGLQDGENVQILDFSASAVYGIFNRFFVEALLSHCNSILDVASWTKRPILVFNFVVWAVTLIWLPLSFATDIPILRTVTGVYCEWLLKPAQVFIAMSLIVLLVNFIWFGFSKQKNSAIKFGYTALVSSSLVAWFFINLAIAYNRDVSALPHVGDTASNNAELFVPLHLNNIGWGGTIFGGEILVFGYDYMTLCLCAMTSLVFAFTYLISIYNMNIESKKTFFSFLLLIEVFSLGAFLSLNIVGFVVFFEATLLPTALLIGKWGSSSKRWFAAKQFLIYSLLGSIPLTVAVIYMYNIFGTLNYLYILNNIDQLSSTEQLIIWWCFFIAFAIKVPLVPCHSWLLNAHVEATTAGSIILASVLLKLGAFGFIRYLLGLFHACSVQMAFPACAIALVSIVYASISSITEVDAKRLIAHTSIAHMSFVVLGLFTFDVNSTLGSIYLMLGHSIVTAGLFYLVGIVYDRFHTRDLTLIGGLASVMPLFSTALFYFVMSNAGFPWSLSFIGELFIMSAVFKTFSFYTFLVLIVAFVCLLYTNLRLFSTICFGSLNEKYIGNAVTDLSHFELFCAVALISNGFCLMLGNDLYFFMLSWDLLLRYIY